GPITVDSLEAGVHAPNTVFSVHDRNRLDRRLEQVREVRGWSRRWLRSSSGPSSGTIQQFSDERAELGEGLRGVAAQGRVMAARDDDAPLSGAVAAGDCHADELRVGPVRLSRTD